MENQGNVICRARFKSSFMPFVVLIVVFAILFGACIGLNKIAMKKIADDYPNATYTRKNGQYDSIKKVYNDKGLFSIEYGGDHNEGGGSGYYSDKKTTYIFGIKLSYKIDSGHGYIADRNSDKCIKYSHSKSYAGGKMVLIITIIASLLLVLKAFLPMIIAKRCSLALSADKIEGQLKNTFGKKNLQMPIDHLDSVMTANSLMDKLRGGETIIVSSNSGIIRFHYVQNAEEFTACTGAERYRRQCYGEDKRPETDAR